MPKAKTKQVSDEHYRLLIERMCKAQYVLHCEEIAKRAADEATVDADLYIYREYRELAEKAQKELKNLEAKIAEHEKG